MYKGMGDEIKFLWTQLKGFSDLPSIVQSGNPSPKLIYITWKVIIELAF
jgi:hypothetical protein